MIAGTETTRRPRLGAQSGSRIYQSPKFAKIQNSHVGGGGGGTNFQLLMLSSNLLKSKIPISRGGGRGWWNQLSTFDAEFKFAKIQNSDFQGGGGWWNQLSTFDAEFKFAKIQNSHFWVGGGGG